MSRRSTELSRLVSYVLRHRPDAYGLRLDEEGWVALDDLVAAVARSDPKWRNLTADDIRAAADANAKRRFEFSSDCVRSLYGHSVPDRIAMTPATPPQILYHGTTPEALAKIRRTGLQPMNRQYVHLSPDVATATRVAARRTRSPVVLKVLAGQAACQGVEFYQPDDGVWLSDAILPAFVEFPECE
jgi:putative RNA 2'-phosphotransferase